MDYTTIFMIVFSLHSSCFGGLLGDYIPPNGDVCPCDGQKKNVIVDMSTIRINKTELLPPIMATKSLPPVTSFITLPVVNETVTVIETMPQNISIIDFTLPSTTTIHSSLVVSITEIKDPVTKTKTQKVTEFVPAKTFISRLFLTSTESQEPIITTISFASSPTITNTVTFPLSISLIKINITVTEALPPIIKTVRFGSTTTVRQRTVFLTPPPVTIQSTGLYLETYTMTRTVIPSPVTKFRHYTTTIKNRDCKYDKDE